MLDAVNNKPIPHATLTHSQLHSVIVGISINSDGTFSQDFVGEKLSLTIKASGYKPKNIEVNLKIETNTNFGDLYLERI